MASQLKPVISPKWKHGDWFYNWQGNGMLEGVKRPDGTEIRFEYDALGRRTAKINEATKEITRFAWDGNVPLHEWKYALENRPQIVANELGELSLDKKEITNNLVTWVFDEGSCIPSAKITAEDTYSIISDYLGTPVLAYNGVGNQVWKRELDIFGNVRVGDSIFVPFLYQGQYYDNETELAYNRFRYYSPENGMYVSQDPIGLEGNMPNIYSYVSNSNIWVDTFGLYSDLLDTGMGHHLMPRSIAKQLGITELSPDNAIAWYPNVGKDTSDLHKQLHRDLIDQNLPYHGSKFTGTVDEFFAAAKKAYAGITTKGFLKIPYTDDKLFKNLTPLEAIIKLEQLYKSNKIPCK